MTPNPAFERKGMTAKPFYERNSYLSNGGAILVHRVQNAFPMAKAIAR